MNEKFLKLMRNLPKLNLYNTINFRNSYPPAFEGLKHKKRGLGHRGFGQFQSWRPLGIESNRLPWYLKVPSQDIYSKHYFRRQLLRLSLRDLQRMIDLFRIDVTEPIDLTTICNTKLFLLDTKLQKHYGFHLTEEGSELFCSKVNIEVQYASEAVIATIERLGGVITTRFYDLYSVDIKKDPESFFYTGLPIPKAKSPPLDALRYYTDAANRGYLCDQSVLEFQRKKLAQKYGYELPNINNDNLMAISKDARQLFYDLEPGWVVNMVDKEILIPKDDALKKYYQS